MSTLSDTTADIDIQRPELWSLELRLDKDGIQFIIFCNEIDNSLIYRDIRFDKNSGNYLQALENCVYDNSVLLLDYKNVSIAVESDQFVIAPMLPDAADSDNGCIFTACYPDADSDIHVCEMEKCAANTIFGTHRGVISFLQRTFNNPTIVHHLQPLCEYFKGKTRESGISKMFLYFHGNRMEMCIFAKGRFTMANTFTFRSVNDALFFTLHAWQAFKMDVHNDELQLSGDKSTREALSPMLRKYINYVMPVIFPASALKIGQDAIKAPFDLILLSLCE